MKVTETAVKHPITTAMVFLAVFTLGMVAMGRLGLELFPDITMPTAVIYTVHPGVGPYEIESGLTKPIETGVSGMNGVERVSSTSSESLSMVTISFVWGTNMDTIVMDIREKINAIEDTLPEGAQRPVIMKYNPENLPSLRFNVSTKTKGIDARQMAEEKIVPALEKIEGVAQVSIYGGQEKAVTCRLDLDSLIKTEIPITQILQIFQTENISLPGGSITSDNQYILIRTIGEFTSIEDIQNVLIGYKDNIPIYLYDVAENISVDYLPQEEFVRAGSETGVMLAVRKQPGHNTVEVNDKVKEKLEELKSTLPPSLNLQIQSDQSISILDSIGGVIDAAWQGGLLAILVLLLFLRNIRSTLIVAVVIPVSVIATFSLMDFSGITMNMVSLMGITLGIGMFVDNAIVVLESSFRKQLTGMNPIESAIEGTGEVGQAIIASTLTTVAVFLPTIFVEGISGLIFRDLAFTISFALSVSLIVALTLTPVICSKFLRISKNAKVSKSLEGDEHHELSLADVEIKTGNKILDAFSLWIQNGLLKLDELYEKGIRWALSHSLVIIIGAILLFGLSVFAIGLMGMEFLPETDEARFSISIETQIGFDYSYTESKVIQIENIIHDEVGDHLESLSAAIGQGAGLTDADSGSHLAAVYVTLNSRDKRERDIWEIVDTLNKRFQQEVLNCKFHIGIDGMSALMNIASGGGDPISIELIGNDIDKLYDYAKKVQNAINETEGTRNTRMTHKVGKPELQLRVKRREALSLGLSPYEIAATIRTAYKGTEVTRFSLNGEDYEVIMMLDEDDRNDIERIKNLFFVNRAGTKIPLENVIETVEAKGPLSVNRKDRTRYIRVSAALTGDVALNRVTENVLAKIETLGPPPTGVEMEVGGSSKEMNSSFESLMYALLLAVALVYMVMAAQFESLLHPFIVMFSIPFAIIGLVGAMLITNTTFSMMAFIGAILLVGVVVNNAIVLIDYMNLLIRRGVPIFDAIIKGGRTRLKPILMTSMTTILGLLPMAIGFGSGAELRAPMGRAVVGGLVTSTLVTLILIPTIYWVVETKLRRKKHDKIHSDESAVAENA